MNDTLILVLAVASVFGVIVMVWKLLSCLQSVTGQGVRAHERERHDYLRTIEHLIEKNESQDKARTAILHTQERMAQLQVDSVTEIKTSAGPPKEGLVKESDTIFSNDPDVLAAMSTNQ